MKNKPNKQNGIQQGKPNRTSIQPGSTTQGGPNFGQGSLQLGRYSNKQGSEANKGSNYRNEQGWNNEALRKEDLQDYGNRRSSGQTSRGQKQDDK